MTRLSSVAVLPLCLVLIGAMPPEASAKNNKHNTHRSEIHWDRADKSNSAVTISIGTRDRAIIRDYLRQNTRSNCPPGLAKKNNGCLPPGQAKKYAIGQRLPGGIGIAGLPGALLSRLSAPPRGYRYGMIDNDVVLMSSQDRLIADAVSVMLGQ